MLNPRRARRTPTLLMAVVLAGVFALVASILSTPAQARSSAAPVAATPQALATKKPVKQHDRVWRASAALARAQKALSGATPAGERPDATMALRNLMLLKDALPAADRAAAERLAKRPTKPATMGDAHILLHYDPTEVGAYDIDEAFRRMQDVANTYAGSGYRRPKPDKRRGGDSRTDIYIDALQPGVYGYCTSDQKVRVPRYDLWSYCVIDNDFDFSKRDPLENFKVTAAHEYFHATQFAYDAGEDGWFLEATATWAEDQLYDLINDNYQYLSRSPITLPRRPIDMFEDGGSFHYGVWNFIRYLTERHPQRTGALPSLVLRAWQYAESSKAPRRDLYSTRALNKALKKTKSSLAKDFARYSAITRVPRVYFAEEEVEVGRDYPIKRAKGQTVLSAGKRKAFKTKLDHLTSATYYYGNGGGASKLKVKFKMGNKVTRSRAILLTYYTDGRVATKLVKLNRKGLGKKSVAFGPDVKGVDVTLVNASTRVTRCYSDLTNAISCSGKARDNNVGAIVKAKAS